MAKLPKFSLLSLFLLLTLQACGGRMADPVMQYNALDTAFSCEHLQAEFNLNRQKYTALKKEEDKRNLGNAAQLIIGSPLLLDLTKTIDQERVALETRNEEIKRLGFVKICAPFETKEAAATNPMHPKKAAASTEDLFPIR